MLWASSAATTLLETSRPVRRWDCHVCRVRRVRLRMPCDGHCGSCNVPIVEASPSASMRPRWRALRSSDRRPPLLLSPNPSSRPLSLLDVVLVLPAASTHPQSSFSAPGSSSAGSGVVTTLCAASSPLPSPPPPHRSPALAAARAAPVAPDPEHVGWRASEASDAPKPCARTRRSISESGLEQERRYGSERGLVDRSMGSAKG
jgi:hypothetical protein